jgi:hypothetical protein
MQTYTTPQGYKVDNETILLIRGEVLLATNGSEYLEDETILKMVDIFKSMQSN